MIDIKALGPIDCDIHPALPNFAALLPHLDEYWREMALVRGLDEENFDLTSFPPSAPINGRPDWRPKGGNPGTALARLRRQTLDHFGSRIGICNVLHGAMAVFNSDMAAAFCRA